MAAKGGKGKGKDDKNKKPEPVYSDVNVCWKREKELAAEAASTGPAQMDDAMKESLTLQINELSSRVDGYVTKANEIESNRICLIQIAVFYTVC